MDGLKPTEGLHNLAHFCNDFFGNSRSNNHARHSTRPDNPYTLETLHGLSLIICAELDNIQPTLSDDLESENDDETCNYDDESWESLVPSDMMIVHPMLTAALHPVPNSPSPPPNQYTMSTAGSFMSSWLRGFTSPTNSPTSPHK